jgi:hypothetical protein
MNYGHNVRDLLLELKRSEEAMITSSATGGTQPEIAKLATVAIPSYNDNSVRMALLDFTLHVQALQEQALAAATAAASTDDDGNSTGTRKPSMTVRPSIVLQNMACQRNKRGLLLYHVVRMQRIQELLYWQSGVGTTSSDTALNNTSTINDDDYKMDDPVNTRTDTVVLQNLCPSEKEFLYNYQQLIDNYMNEQQLMTDASIVDLRAHCTIPPITVDRVVCRVIDTAPFLSASNDNDDSLHDPEQRNNNRSNSIVLESGQCVNFTLGSTHYLLYSDCEEYIRCGALQVVEIEET